MVKGVIIMTDQVCYVCGTDMKTFDIIDKDSGEKVAEEIACPNEWHSDHTRAKT